MGHINNLWIDNDLLIRSITVWNSDLVILSVFFTHSVISPLYVVASAGGSQHLWRQRIQPAQPDGGLRLLRTSFRKIQQLFRDLSLPLLPQRRHLRGSAAPLLRVQHQHSSQGGHIYMTSWNKFNRINLCVLITVSIFPFRLEAWWSGVQSCEPLDLHWNTSTVLSVFCYWLLVTSYSD